MKTFILLLARVRFMFIFMIALPQMSYSQPGNYYSLNGGDYFSLNIWGYNSQINSCGCVPDNDGICTISIPANKTVHIKHAVSANCDLYIGANSIIMIESGGSLILGGNSNIIGDGVLQVDSGASVSVSGYMDLRGNANVLNNGFISIGSDLLFSGNASLCGTGSIYVGGTISGGSPCGIVTSNIELTDNSIEAQNISFFPNPNKGDLYVHFTGINNKDGEFIIRNTMGETVLKNKLAEMISGINETSIQLQGLPDGVYFCTFTIDDARYTQKIVLDTR